ncbi:MAG: hypothetical protein COB02_18285 [Candidatus Cloacimonadota bacterium]|nr:MAG: hypothetical protein COB02_18285 [Candidatus Cloacimonadota bacterium]
MDFIKCTEESNNKIIKAEENGKKFIIKNESRYTIRKIKVDGCLIDDVKTKKCDYLFEIEDEDLQVFYVELKGCRVDDAIFQIEATIELLSLRHKNNKKSCYIVASSSPKVGPKRQILMKKFNKKYKCELKFSSRQEVVTL